MGRKTEEVIVRKAGRHTSFDVRHSLFGGETAPTPVVKVKEAIRKYARQRYARD
ncbi:MAG: hypothetical protein OEL91_04375 [Burkholderiaceae bacterium]|nr:hypothetical protein [Burkholderiaceae bacterium]